MFNVANENLALACNQVFEKLASAMNDLKTSAQICFLVFVSDHQANLSDYSEATCNFIIAAFDSFDFLKCEMPRNSEIAECATLKYDSGASH